jgi:hypothetical protein
LRPTRPALRQVVAVQEYLSGLAECTGAARIDVAIAFAVRRPARIGNDLADLDAHRSAVAGSA